ncbi:hypothetical protein AXF42_Ash009750 [Apostasia shenzhenica]|uniref:Uncharacterized protein n=1 Tax=Apostasia shenzhenica TaxID=1088818 RepID=A0A2I0AX30_9ASPA|nr:hypothetical protein AXF42_Ash009750 [Apostasia shenzhenica]
MNQLITSHQKTKPKNCKYTKADPPRLNFQRCEESVRRKEAEDQMEKEEIAQNFLEVCAAINGGLPSASRTQISLHHRHQITNRKTNTKKRSEKGGRDGDQRVSTPPQSADAVKEEIGSRV